MTHKMKVIHPITSLAQFTIGAKAVKLISSEHEFAFIGEVGGF